MRWRCLPALRCGAGDALAHHRKGTLTLLAREKWTPFETGFRTKIGRRRKKENPAGNALWPRFPRPRLPPTRPPRRSGEHRAAAQGSISPVKCTLTRVCNALGRTDALVTPHPCWRALASSAQARCATYRRFVSADIDPAETEAIRLFLHRQHALGSAHFRAAIETQLGRRAGPAKIGRPRKDQSGRESAL